jgi:hypothetical protein
MIAGDTCIAGPTSQSLKRSREDGNILSDSSATKMSVEGAASGVSKKSRRECREEKRGGVTPKSNERKGVQQKSTHQESEVEVDLLCFCCKQPGHIVKDFPDANNEQKKELLKRKWKEWKA